MNLVVTKTPLRVSFFGGGTDLRSFYKACDGYVISSTINKFLYVTVKKNEKYVDYKYRVNWSKTEFANNIKDIKHPIVREVLKYFKINFPIEISTFADIPASTGLGSSSAFAVGLIKGVTKLLKKNFSNKKIAQIAAKIEVDVLKRNIGKQDHYACAIGGMNFYKFRKDESVQIIKNVIPKHFSNILNNHMFLFFLNKKRDASYILESQKKLDKSNIQNLKEIKNIAKQVIKNLNVMKKNKFLKYFGEQLSKSWFFKKKNNKKVSYKFANQVYEYACLVGVYGGKILGAGGGGFFFFLTNKKIALKMQKKFKNISLLKVEMYEKGSEYLYIKK